MLHTHYRITSKYINRDGWGGNFVGNGRYEGGRMTALCESLVLDTSKGEMQVAYIHNSYRAGGGKSMVAKNPWLCTPKKTQHTNELG
jgi:hypothetical protein